MFDVFINYRSADARFGAAATFELLSGRFGRSRVFLDNQSMGPGAVYPEQIRAALESMRVLVVLIGPAWLAATGPGVSPLHRDDDWVRREIRVALERAVPIVPVLLDGVSLPAPEQLPDDVRPLLFRQAAGVRHHTLGADIARLARYLERFLPASQRSNRVVPHQLPASTHLVGREDEFGRLDDLLRTGDRTVPIVVVSGAAGVGKTALASRWAHQVADEFPDGQLYVDLRGFGPDEPVAPMEALSGFLRTLGVARPEELTDQAERSARFRTLMSGRRAVVVLDNARSAAQVQPLLPGAGPAVVVVTSRDVLGELRVRHTSALVRLEPLDATAGVGLLTAGVGERAVRQPAAAGRLASLCGGLPLALRIVTERLVSQPSLSIARLVDELDDERARLTALSELGAEANVRTVFSWSYQRIDGIQAAVFRAAGLAPGRGFDANTIAAVTGRPTSSVERALADLDRAHLVTDLGGGRYSMHDLLHAYANEVATADHDPAPADAVRRLSTTTCIPPLSPTSC